MVIKNADNRRIFQLIKTEFLFSVLKTLKSNRNIKNEIIPALPPAHKAAINDKETKIFINILFFNEEQIIDSDKKNNRLEAMLFLLVVSENSFGESPSKA